MDIVGRNEDTIVSHILRPSIMARFVRIKSKLGDHHGDWALRFDLLGRVCTSSGRQY